MTKFLTNWITTAGSLGSVTENGTVSIQLSANQRAILTATAGQTIIQDVPVSMTVTSVIVNGFTAAYNHVGNVIQMTSPLNAGDLVIIQMATPITFSMLHGQLPAGLTMNSTGLISGKVSKLPATNDSSDVIYTFGIRASDGTSSADRIFKIEAIHTSSAISPPAWGNLPSQKSNGIFNYIPLGRTSKGVKFLYNIDIFNPSGLQPQLVVEVIGEVDAPYNELPADLTVDNSGKISGIVNTDLPNGDYFFKITMKDNNGNAITTGSGQYPYIFNIKIAAPENVLEPLRFIIWNTAAGSLGSLAEIQPSPFSINATCTTGEAIRYALKSGTLPLGLTLNTTTGDINGVATHISSDVTSEFTIKATVVNTDISSERTFSIKIVSKFVGSNIVNVQMKIKAVDYDILKNYYSDIITSNYYFRQNDDNFGSIASNNNMTMLIVGGINANLNSIETTLRNSKIKGTASLLLGTHKYAKATINGKTIYEVIYREVIDPLENAGGFKVIKDNPIVDHLYYPENPSIEIFPNSINNIRYQFITTNNFASKDPSLLTNIGEKSPENLPLWMTSTQDDGTKIGYVKAVEIAFVKPDTAEPLVKHLNDISIVDSGKVGPTNPINRNHSIMYDQLFIEYINVSIETTFDGGHTTFDSGSGFRTRFDTYSFLDGHLLRFNK